MLTNIAYCCNRLQQWEEAEDIGLRVFKQRIEQRGCGHPDTLTIMGSLAWTYRRQERFQEAEELDRKVLARRLEILGPENPKTQLTMGALAEVCGLLHHWERARDLQRQVVEAKQRTVGAQRGSIKRAEKYLELVEAVIRDKRNEEAAIQWLKQSGWKGPARKSRGHHSHSNLSRDSYHDSVIHSRNWLHSIPASLFKQRIGTAYHVNTRSEIFSHPQPIRI